MKILGTTPRGYVVEILEYEMNRLVNFASDSNGARFQAGVELDMHAIYGKVAAVATATRTLKQTAGSLADAVKALETPPTTEPAA